MNMDDALDRLRQQINKSRAIYVPGTPEKYPATQLRGLTVLEAEALLAQAEQLREERDRLASSGGAYMVRAVAAEAEVRRLKSLEAKLVLGRDWLGKDLARAKAAEAEVQRLREGLREIEQTPLGRNRLTDGEIIVAIRAKARAALSASPSDGGGAK